MKLFAMIIILGFIQGVAQGAISDAEYKRRHSRASRTLNSIDLIESRLKEYESLRERYFSKLVTDSKEFFRASNSWVKCWSTILMDIKLGVDFSKYMGAIELEFSKQQNRLKNLKLRSEKVRRLSIKVKELSPEIVVNFSHLPSRQQKVVADLNNRITEMKEAADSIFTETRSNIGDMDLTGKISYKAIKVKVKLDLLDSGVHPLEESLAKFSDMASYYRVAVPIIRDLESYSLKMSSLSMDFAYFQGKRVKAIADKLCEKVRETSTVSALSDEYIGLFRKKAGGLCQSINTSWRTLSESGLSIPEMVGEYSFLMSASYQALCEAGGTTVDCQRLKTLQSVDLQTLSNYSNAQLKDHEYSWNQLKFSNQ